MTNTEEDVIVCMSDIVDSCGKEFALYPSKVSEKLARVNNLEKGQGISDLGIKIVKG